MRILVTGKQGQVVQALLQRSAAAGVEIQVIGRPEMDMADPAQTLDAMRSAITAFQPDIIVNAAAYTAVDQAEDEPVLAHAINAAGAGAVAQAAADSGLPIIQISTDYVFDGTKDSAYIEADTPNPQGVYGASKLAGENAVRAANPQHLIFRTAWVYSPFGKNFVKTMLRLAETRDEISVVADQFGNPTSAFDIADGILAAARRIEADVSTTPWGTYHLAGRGHTHWAGFAEEIFCLSAARGGPTATVKRIATAEYPTKAKRPANSQLECAAFEVAFGWKAGAWESSVPESLNWADNQIFQVRVL
jgi:dTDP-4-dehydrorhamnose reductase